MKASAISMLFAILLVIETVQVQAYFNATYLTTTVFLTNSTTVHVVESTQLYVSNASIGTYNQDRQAFNLSLNDWQKAVGSPFLVQHILNPKGSISNFTFLPGPITPAENGGGYASLTISYDAKNITDVVNVAPRKFEYAFNNSVFNFLHTGSGQSLLPNTRLTMMVPAGAQLVKIFPVPDYPQPNSVGQYNSTSFAWFSGEPLQNFDFIYITTQTPQQEVIQYFSGVYENYKPLIYLLVILIIVVAAFYIYIKVFR